ncbi:hypothetical protein EV702DRAFT_1206293 [Suillus placidus]|uniref:Uncharacterized protein n=1 Tax=Suillus placidus TaxID=48579 RepID=A0A9P6ZF31_9AGAM|nr:hypothetical protein EV702DRAFT_1206293 [Suillus placidus]
MLVPNFLLMKQIVSKSTHRGLQFNVDVLADLEANFAWALPLAPQTQNIDDSMMILQVLNPHYHLTDKIDAAFALLECEKEATEQEPVDRNEVSEGQVYDFAELEHVDQGLAPKSVDEEIMVVDHTSHNNRQWDVDALMSSNGVSYGRRGGSAASAGYAGTIAHKQFCPQHYLQYISMDRKMSALILMAEISIWPTHRNFEELSALLPLIVGATGLS